MVDKSCQSIEQASGVTSRTSSIGLTFRLEKERQ